MRYFWLIFLGVFLLIVAVFVFVFTGSVGLILLLMPLFVIVGLTYMITGLIGFFPFCRNLKSIISYFHENNLDMYPEGLYRVASCKERNLFIYMWSQSENTKSRRKVDKKIIAWAMKQQKYRLWEAFICCFILVLISLLSLL